MDNIKKLAEETLTEIDSTDTWEWRDAAKTLARAVLEQDAQLALMREALEAVEWVDDHCSYCGYLKPNHDLYCLVNFALAGGQAGNEQD